MKVLAILFMLLFPASLCAQRSVSIRPQRASTEQVVAPLLRLDPRAAAHSLSAYLPGDALLTIESQGLSYWPARTELTRLAQVAAGAVRSVQDSFRMATSEKCVAIHLPVVEETQTVQYTENTGFANLVLRSGSAQAALKAGFDTVRIMKTYSVKKTKKDTARLQQIQYTFVVKSLQDLEGIAANDALLDDVARTMDSVVARRRARWGRDDAWYHSLEAVYRPELGREEKKRLVVQRGLDEKGDKGTWKGVIGSFSIGTTLLRNTLMPTAEFGIGYRWPKGSLDHFKFLRLSLSTLSDFVAVPSAGAGRYWSETNIFLNLESGKIFNRPRTLLPLYRTSFGVGWAFGQLGGGWEVPPTPTAPPVSKGAIRLFLNYSASKTISILPELYLAENAAYLPALSLKVTL